MKLAKRCLDEEETSPVLTGTFNKSSKDDSKWIRFRWRRRFVVVGMGMFAWYTSASDVHARGTCSLDLLQRVDKLEPADIGGKVHAFDVREATGPWRC